MKQDVKDVLRVCQVFYVLAHIIVFSLFIYLHNSSTDLKISAAFFWLIKLISLFLFFFAGSKPGYLSEKGLEKDFAELQESDWEVPIRHYCDTCELSQPYRTKHCDLCEQCICKYDHHCFWLGSCIGELNHFKFTLYLTLESISLWWAILFCFEGHSFSSELLYFLIGLLCGSFGFLTTGLAALHVYLISIGSTTWELTRRNSITYLAPYPYNIHPFSLSFFSNWKSAISTSKVTNWTLPRPQIIYPFNWCENKYWSCC